MDCSGMFMVAVFCGNQASDDCQKILSVHLPWLSFWPLSRKVSSLRFDVMSIVFC